MRIAYNFGLVTTTKDIVNSGCRNNIDARVFLGIRSEQFLDGSIFCYVAGERGGFCLQCKVCISRFIIGGKAHLCQVILQIASIYCHFCFILCLCQRDALGNGSNTFIGLVLSDIATTTVLLIAIDGVGRQIATGIQFTDANRLAATFLDIHSNGTCNSS